MELIVAQIAVDEGRPCAGEIEGPHPEEALVIEGDDRVFRGHRAIIPVIERHAVMEPEHLHIGDHHLGLLARGNDLRQRGIIAAWEDIFQGEGVGFSRHAEPSDGVEQHDPIVGEQLAAFVEEYVILRHADMLEHPDRHDPVESSFERAIIDQFEPHPVRDAGRLGARPGHPELFLGQGDAEHVDVGDPVQIERHPAPAAADVEHPLPRLQMEFRGDMRLLVGLRLIEAVRRIGEIGAAILAVDVEEEVVESIVQIIMMGDVAPRGACAVETLKPPLEPILDEAGQRTAQGDPPLFPFAVGADEVDQVANVALLKDDPPVHIGFGGMEMRIARNEAHDPFVGHADRHRPDRRIGRAEGLPAAVGKDHRQFAAPEQIADELVQQRHGWLLPGSIEPRIWNDARGEVAIHPPLPDREG